MIELPQGVEVLIVRTAVDVADADFHGATQRSPVDRHQERQAIHALRRFASPLLQSA